MGLRKLKENVRFSYGDYLAWGNEGRWELIDGEVFDMTPGPGRIHQEIALALTLAFGSFFEGKTCRVYPAPFDVRLPKKNEIDEEIDTVVQPDLIVVCDKKKLDEKGCRGAPELVVDILSPSTASLDSIKKRDLYEKFAVKESWLVHPTDRLLYIYSLDKNGEFGRPRIFSDDQTVSPLLFPGLKIKLSQVFPALPPAKAGKKPPK